MALAAGCSRAPALTAAETALRDYVRAAKAGDCEKAWTLTSARTQAALEYLECRGRSMPAKTLLCNTGAFFEASAEQPRTLSQSDDRATVAIQYKESYGPALPGFSGILVRDKNVPFDVVREDGQWKVEETRVVERVEKELAMIRTELERMRAEYERRGMEPPAQMRGHCALQAGRAG